MNTKSIAYAIAYLISGLVVGGLLYFLVQASLTGNPPVYSKRTMLESLWFHYKKEYLEPDTFRALDKQRENITTSEGQSYTMLRAVWMDDKETFDASWQWTKDNLQREEDHLFHWLFGERQDGTYGILADQGGENSATDADTDIALSLLFASKRWNNNDYFGDAIEIIRDVWEKEVVTIGGRPYIVANNIEKIDETKSGYIVNPSYYSPYAYRIFAEVDPGHDWLGVVDTSYEVIALNASSSLDTGNSAGIPSDWLMIDKSTASVSRVASDSNLTTNFSYDALRLPWRLALDVAWFGEDRAKEALAAMSFFEKEWESRGAIASSYRHDGAIVESKETAAMYGGIIGYFMVANALNAPEVYAQKLERLYNSDTFNWRESQGYYDSNWAWFGLALYNDLLPQLYPTADHNSLP